MSDVKARDHQIMNSELAVKVLRRIAHQENGDYGSRIAKNLDKSQSSIGRVLGALHDLDFIIKADRRRAQYYKINYNKIGQYWWCKVRQDVECLEEDLDTEKWLEKEVTDKQEIINNLEENRDRVEEIAGKYVKEVLEDDESIEGLTLSDLMFDSFAYSVGHNLIEDEEFIRKHDCIKGLKDALTCTRQTLGYPPHLRKAIYE